METVIIYLKVRLSRTTERENIGITARRHAREPNKRMEMVYMMMEMVYMKRVYMMKGI